MRSRSTEAATGAIRFFLFPAVVAALVPADAFATQNCVRAEIVLWGDGRHDDTAALNAWLRGENAIWGESGEPIGGSIAGRRFRLSAAIYVPGGSNRRLDDFRLLWPERGETVSGGTIASGGDPDDAPVVSGVSIVGGDGGEGKPFEAPDPITKANPEASCATS
jgi:hypothetical protein